MPDQNIDIECKAALPNSQSRVFIQLREYRPERVFYRVNLKAPNSKIIHVAAPDTYAIPIRHDLGRNANELAGYQVACRGIVGFVASGKWKLICEILVGGEVVHTCPPGELEGAPGEMSPFRFVCSLG